jgi:hypothetical protein
MTYSITAAVVASLGFVALIPAALPAPRDRGDSDLRAPKNDDFSSGYRLMGSGSGSGGPPCPADLDGSGTVDGSDLGVLLSAWGSSSGDTNGDGNTDGEDLGILLSAWGVCAQ